MIDDKIEDVNQGFRLAVESMTAVCECGDVNCAEQLEIDQATYEQVRSDPTWFVIVPGQEVADVEAIVARHDGFDVVCKHEGAGEAVAIDTDPRS